MIRQAWVSNGDAVSVVQQCVLAGVSRATVYAHQKLKPVDRPRLVAQPPDRPRIHAASVLRQPQDGYIPQHIGAHRQLRRVQRLMREMGLAGMAPGPNTSRAQPEHKVYPYLLRGVAVVRPNQVWSTDITYIRLRGGFVYLVAIIDWYLRRVLSWRISNSMEAAFCVDCLEEALRAHGKPEIFNSDQGSQFTSAAFTGVLNREGITLSMDGRGRAFDNIFVEQLWRSVKHEDVYLKGYATVGELTIGLIEYFVFYNGERPHQSLGQLTPDLVYQAAIGGGAMIMDKYPRAEKEEKSKTATSATALILEVPAKYIEKTKPGQRCSAASEVKCTA